MFADTPVCDNIGPALLALFPFIVIVLVTSITALRERRTGALERLLSMPLGRGDLILGHTLGLLASAFARTEFQVEQFMPLLVFPQILLGGLFLPQEQLPDKLRTISD